MATTGEVFPTAATSTLEAPWEDNVWLTEGNILADDAATAEVVAASFDNGDQTYVLKGYTFDFSGIPAGATIDGVICRVNCWYGDGGVYIDLMQLLDVDRAKVGTNQYAVPVELDEDTATIYTKGGAADLWGNALNLAWVQDADFGVALGFAAKDDNADVFVDYVSLEVYYTEAGGETINFEATITGASATPDVPVLAVHRPLIATATGISGTTDIPVLAVRRALSATATAVTVTPDISILAILRSLLATMAAASSTPDDGILTVHRALVAIVLAESLTSTPILSISGLIAFEATITTATVTPDIPILAVHRPLAATITGASATPDDGILAVLRPLLATATAVTMTPDIPVLVVHRAFVAALTGASATSDDGVLAVHRPLVATATAATVTPDIPALAILRPLVATSTTATVTPDVVSLAMLRSLVATATAASNTSIPELLIWRALVAVLLAQTLTSNPILIATGEAAVPVVEDEYGVHSVWNPDNKLRQWKIRRGPSAYAVWD